LFHFGYPPLLKKFYRQRGRQLTALFKKVDEMGVVTSLDFSLPDDGSEAGNVNWGEVLKQTLPFTDVFMPSLEEALKMVFPYEYTRIEAEGGDFINKVPLDMIKELCETLVTYGAKIVLIKAAHRGLYLWTGNIASINNKGLLQLSEQGWHNQQLCCGAYEVVEEKIKNASGAGDTSVAAFLTAILNGDKPGIAMKYAALAGRNNLYCNNIFEGMPDWAMMTEELNRTVNEVVDINDLLVNTESRNNL